MVQCCNPVQIVVQYDQMAQCTVFLLGNSYTVALPTREVPACHMVSVCNTPQPQPSYSLYRCDPARCRMSSVLSSLQMERAPHGYAAVLAARSKASTLRSTTPNTTCPPVARQNVRVNTDQPVCMCRLTDPLIPLLSLGTCMHMVAPQIAAHQTSAL